MSLCFHWDLTHSCSDVSSVHYSCTVHQSLSACSGITAPHNHPDTNQSGTEDQVESNREPSAFSHCQRCPVFRAGILSVFFFFTNVRADTLQSGTVDDGHRETHPATADPPSVSQRSALVSQQIDGGQTEALWQVQFILAVRVRVRGQIVNWLSHYYREKK